MRRENFLELDADAAAGVRGTAGTVVGWNRLALQAIRAAQPGPLASARALAILHTCMYNAWAAYDRRARQTAHGAAVRLPQAERNPASKASAMSHAAHLALSGCFPAQQVVFDAWMDGLGLDPAAPSGHLSPPGIGRTQAASMLAFCQRHGHVHGNARPGGLDRALAAEPVPGRWCLAAQRLSARGGHGDDQDVRLFFALATALADAAIAGWGGADRGGGDAAERPAALHGSAGAAAAEVLRRFTKEIQEEMREEMPDGLPGATQDAACVIPGAAVQQRAHQRGRQLGARAYEEARRHWQGSL